jgi:hypothetical protein
MLLAGTMATLGTGGGLSVGSGGKGSLPLTLVGDSGLNLFMFAAAIFLAPGGGGAVGGDTTREGGGGGRGGSHKDGLGLVPENGDCAGVILGVISCSLSITRPWDVRLTPKLLLFEVVGAELPLSPSPPLPPLPPPSPPPPMVVLLKLKFLLLFILPLPEGLLLLLKLLPLLLLLLLPRLMR